MPEEIVSNIRLTNSEDSLANNFSPRQKAIIASLVEKLILAQLVI